LSNELWLEVEKNEVIKLCLDSKVRTWETKLHSKNLNDSCIEFQVPTLIGVESINVYLPESDSSHRINLSIGMKYFNFKNEEVLIGYNEFRGKDSVLKRIISSNPVEEDPERLISVTGSYLVDKYPVTNCEITQLMWDSISMEPSLANSRLQKYANQWMERKKRSERNKNCMPKDTAACTVFLLQAMKYANARSIREGLKPYYKFSKTDEQEEQKILSKGHYIIGFFDLSKSKDRLIQVTVDKSSDGYRLPYYDEWMIFARGGNKKNEAPWGDSSVTFEEASKYARFDTWEKFEVSEPVGQLLPNGYGLYDIFGLINEHVLFEEKNPFHFLKERPSCLKGGDNRVAKDYNRNSYSTLPYWKWVNYGFYESNYNGGQIGGFRLIRNIGNNAKWTEVKSDKE
jgi:formylglycine-generating enzyme required for sulfatase activity